MSGRNSKKNQRLGSSRRGLKGLNRNIEKDDDDDGFQQIAESEKGQDEFHTTSDYHATQFDHPPSSGIEQQTSALECPPNVRGQKDFLMQTELSDRKRKMGSTRKSTGRLKGERKFDDVRTTEELDKEYATQPNKSTSEEQHASLTEEQLCFPSDLSLQTKSSGFGNESETTLMFAVSENKETSTIHHQEIISHSHEVVSDMPIDEAMGESVHSIAVTVAEHDLLREDSVMFNEPQTFSHQETQIASTSGQKRRVGSTRRPLGGKNSENVSVQEHSSIKAEVMDKASLEMSAEMTQTWDDVARDDPSSHTESALLLSQSLLADRAELKEPDVSAGTETMNQSVAFPLVDSEKPLPETSSHHGSPLLNKTEDLDVLNKVLKEAGSYLSDNSQHVFDTRKDTNPSYNFRDVNTEAKKEVLKKKEESQLGKLALHNQESSCSMVQHTVGGSRSFDMPMSNISHVKPTTTNLPYEMSDAVEERQEIHIENNVCHVASVTCDTLTDLVCITEEDEDPHILVMKENMSNERGSETKYEFEMTDQSDIRDHNVTQIIMDVRDNEKYEETSSETIWISQQKPCDKGQEHYSSNISLTHSPTQDDAGKMLENEEVRKGSKETAVNDVTSKSEEMFSFEDSATDRGSHAHQQLFMQSPDKEGYDLQENENEKSEKEEILFSVESENAAFDRGNERSEGTDRVKEMDAPPVLILDMGDADLHLQIEAQNKIFKSTNSAADGTKENVNGASVLVRENKDIGNTVESNMTTESDFLQSSPDAHMEALNVSGNAEKEVFRETILKQSDINIVPEVFHEEEVHTKSTPIVHKRKMGSTQRPLKGENGQRKEIEHQDANETLDTEDTINVEKETSRLESEPSSVESSLQSSKGGPKEEKMEIFEKYDVGLVEGSESALLQSSCSSDLMSEESPPINICHITESQTLTQINVESQENPGDAEEDKILQLEIDSKKKTEKNIHDANVLVREVEVIGDTDTVESNVTTESDFLQTYSDVQIEALKVSENPAKEVSAKTNTFPEQSDISIIPADSHREETRSMSSPVIQKRKMGSTRRPLKGNKGRNKDHDEKENFNLEDEPSPDESRSTEVSFYDISESQTISKSLAGSHENIGEVDKAPAEGDTESQAENKLFVSTALEGEAEVIGDTVTVGSNITTESDFHQTSDANKETSKVSENSDREDLSDAQLEIQPEMKMIELTSEGERTEDTICEASVSVREDELTVDAVIDTFSEQSHINIIPEYSHEEETHSQSSPVVHKRKMGSTRRPLRGNKGQRKELEHHGEKETLDTEDTINAQKETISLEKEPSSDESTLQSLGDGAKEQKMEIFEKYDVGLVEGSESALLQSTCSSDLVSEESPAISICHITESQTLTKINVESQENTGDAERVAAEEDIVLQLEIDSKNKTFDSTTREAEETEKKIQDISVALFREVEVIGDTVTVESNMTTESDFHQTSDVHVEALRISENTEKDISGETNTFPEQSDISIVPGDSHGEETHSKSSPVVHKRKMGSTRRPLKGKKGHRQEIEHQNENETLDTEDMINVEKETISLEKEPSSDEPLQSSKDGVTEQKVEIFEKYDVGLVEGSESALLQSLCSSDLMSEESPAISICHITESQTLTKINVESQENTGDAERVAAEEDKILQLEIDSKNKTFDSTTIEAKETEKNIHDANVLVREVEVIGDTDTVESNITTESDFLQTYPDVHMEALKVSENAEKDISGETNTFPEQSDISIIPADSHSKETRSMSSPVIQKRKMGSTRRPLKGNKGRRKDHDKKEKFNLEDEPSPDESGSTAVSFCDISESQTISKSLAGSHENIGEVDKAPAEGDTESQAENKVFVSTALEGEAEVIGDTVTVGSNITTESDFHQTSDAYKETSKVSENSDREDLSDAQLETHPENTIIELTSEGERTEDTICEANVSVRGDEFTVDAVIVDSNMTIESDLLQSDTLNDAQLLKAPENTESASAVTDSVLLVQDDVTERLRLTDTFSEQSHINIIPEYSHEEETHSQSSPVVHKRKMGSTRRPLRGNKGHRQELEHHGEKETLDTEDTINAQKETISLENEPSSDESLLQSSKDGAKEQKVEIFEKYDVGLVEGSESALLQSSCSSDLMSEESPAISICHITESQTLTTINVESQENTGDAERVAAEEDKILQLEIDSKSKTFDSTTIEAEETEKNIHDANVLVREVEVIGDTVTVESNMTTESDFILTSPDAHMEALKVYEKAEKEVSGETGIIFKQSDISIVPGDSHGEETQSKSSPVVHKRKMGSTRRPLKGKKGQRQEIEHQNENETLDTEDMINVEKETISLEKEPSSDESSLQSSKDGAKEEKVEIFEKYDVGLVEGSESALLQSSCSSDLMSEESPAISICHITESQTLTKINVESQENTGDAERVAAEEDNDLQLEIDSQNKTFDSTTIEAEETEKNIHDANVLVREVEVIGDTDTVESNITTKSYFLQTDAHTEALKVSENAEKDISGETNTFPEQSDISIIPADSYREETRSMSSPVIQKRKMGSTRRPLKGNKGRRKDHDEKEKFNLEDEPSPDESRSTAVSFCDISESQTISKSLAGSHENIGDVDKTPAEGDTESQAENKLFVSAALEGEAEVIGDTVTVGSNITESDFHQTSDANKETSKVSENSDRKDLSDAQLETHPENTIIELTSEGERTEDTICEANVSVRGDEFTVDAVIVDSNMTIESDLLQSDTLNDAQLLKAPENTESASAVLLVQDDVTERLRLTDTFSEQSHINIIPEYSREEETHSQSSPVVHKRKMGSTRRPLRGNKGHRQELEHHGEKETLDTEDMINAQKETISLEKEPSSDESSLQSSKIGAKEQKMEIFEKYDVGLVEGSESALLQSSCSSDLLSEESPAISICHITESQTLTIINVQSQENTGDAERVAAEEDIVLQLEIDSQNQIFDSTTRQTEETEKKIQDISVALFREIEVIGDTVTVESNMTTESDFHQTSDAHVEALRISENDEKEVSGETDIIFKQSDISIVPGDSHGEETQSKSSPVVHKRKMGSTRRPLKGKKGQRQEIEHQNENETLDTEDMINVEKETISLEKEPSSDESLLQSSKDGAKEEKVEIFEKYDVGLVEGSESALLQSSCSSDLMSEESPAISICHITESQTLTKINVESQENTGDAERVAAEEDNDLQLEIDSQNKTFDSTTIEAEETEKNIHDANVLVREVEVIGDTDTVESNITTKSYFLQTDAHTEALKVSENAEKDISGETNTFPEQSDISIITADSHREETRSMSSPVIQKRKMGSTRRPLKGNKGRRKDHDEKEKFNLEDEPSPDESRSTAVSFCDISESQTISKSLAGSHENIGDVDKAPAEGDTESQAENKLFVSAALEGEAEVIGDTVTVGSNITESDFHQTSDANKETSKVSENSDREDLSDAQLEIHPENTIIELTSEGERTEDTICEANVSVRGDEFTVDAVIVDSNMTIESDLLQSDTLNDAQLLKAPENTESASAVTDSVLLVQDDVTERLRLTDTFSEQSHINIIPEYSHGEETHSQSSPVVHKRKMGSTRRPLRGNKGHRQELEHHGEKETLDTEDTINAQKETISLEKEPSSDESSLQSSKDGAKEQKMEIFEKYDVGLVEGSESAFLQSSCSSDLVSEESPAISICHITESQTLTKINVESQENTGDAERVAAEEDKILQLEIDSKNKTFDSTTIEAEETEKNIHDANVLVREVEVIGDTVTVESNMTTESDFLQTYSDVQMEALKVSENAEKKVSGETDTFPEQSDISIVLADSHREETHLMSSPVIQKRKMGSTRRPLKGNKGLRKDDEKEIFNLEDEPSPDKSRSTAVSFYDFSESLTISKILAGSHENIGEVDKAPAEGDTESQAENKLFVSTALEGEAEVIGDTVTVGSNMTTESDFHQTSDAHKDMLKLSENSDHEDLSDTQLEIHPEKKMIELISEGERTEDTICEANVSVRGDELTVDAVIDTFSEQSHINIIPEYSHEEETHSQSSPVVHKRKMGSTRRPLRGNKGQRKELEHHGENETLDTEDTINAQKETISLVNEPSSVESSLQSSKDGAKEEKVKIFEKYDVGLVEGSESALLQSSCSSDLVSEESPAISICHITESQTLTKINVESQENTEDAERVAAEGDKILQLEIDSQNKTFDSTTIEAEETEKNIHDANVLVREVEVIGDTDTVESNMTTESDFLQTYSDVHTEELKVSENTEKDISGETNMFPDQSDNSIVPADSHREETRSMSSPVIQKRKMGSTRRPLKGNKGLRKGHDEKEIFNLEDEPSPDESRSTAVSFCDISESQINTKIHAGSQENIGDVDLAPAEGNTESQAENKTVYSPAFEGEAIEENICAASALDRKVEFIGDAVVVESNMTTRSDLIQNDTSTDAKPKALISEIAENEISSKTDTTSKQSFPNIIPEDLHGDEVHTKLSLNVHKRKMGSTRRPLRGNKGQRKARVESKENNGDSEEMSEEEDTETHSEIQNRDNVVDHNVTQEIINIRDAEDDERKTTKTVGMSVKELYDDLEQRSDVSQTLTGPSQDDSDSHLLQFPERAADFVRDTNSLSDMVVSNALLMEETQIHVSSNDVLPTNVVEINPVSRKSMQKRKMGSTRKRGKRMVNDEEVEEKEGGTENTTIDDETTKPEEKLTLEEAIAGSPVHQQLFSSSADKEGHDIHDIICKSDVQVENSEQNDPNSTINPELLIESECSSNVATEMVSDLPLGDVDTYLDPKQSVIPKESHREDQPNLNPVVQKRKMGSTRKTLRGDKGQGRIAELKKMDGDSKGMAQEQVTEPHLETSARKTEFDEEVEQNFPVEFSHPMASSNIFLEPENGVTEVSQNIHDLSEVSEKKGMDNTGNDSNSLSEAINLNEGTKDKFFLTVSHEDGHQIVSEPEQTENTQKISPTQELRATQDDVVDENNSQKIHVTQEKRRKMGSTRRNPRAMHGKNMAENEDVLGAAEHDLEEALSISQSKEVSSVSSTDLESEMFVGATDLKVDDHLHSSRPTVPETPENTLQICDNQLVNADVTKHPQSETVSTEKRRKMGSTRKNPREGGIRGKRHGYEDTEAEDTNLQISQDSEMSLVEEDARKQTTHDYSNQSEDSLLSEIERALNKTSQSSLSCDRDLIIKEPNPDGLANAPDLNVQENSEIQSLQPMPSAHSEPNSLGGRRRKMGSTRKNPRQQLKAEREDEDKEDGEIDENSKTNKQEKKDLERVEVSVVPNINESKLNKEYLDVSSAHTSSNELEETTVSQEKTSPSTKRKFGSRRANKGKQGLGRLADSEYGNELEDGDHKADSSEVKHKLHSDDLAVCEPCLTLQPENQSASGQRNMESKNEESAPTHTGAGLVSLDQIIKPDSTGAKQTVNVKNRISDTEVVQFNVVMVGNTCVGKTSFIRRFGEGQFTEDYRSTIGVDTCVQTVVLSDRTVKLQIWDTAGQERFHSITTQVFHKADGLVLMYEVTCSKSFISVRDWISQARERAPDDAIMMLLGNKNDSEKREVQIQEGADLAREYNIHFMECSAATGVNVSESMRSLAELLVQRKSQKEKHTTLRREPPQKKSGCC